MDEMTGALVGLAALCGLAIGRARGSSETANVLLNERDYLRGKIARDAGETYTPPPQPKSTARRIPFPDFGKKRDEEAA